MASRQKRLLELKSIRLQLEWVSQRLDELEAIKNLNLSISRALSEEPELKTLKDTIVQVDEQEVFSSLSSSPDLTINWDSPPIFDDYSDEGYLIEKEAMTSINVDKVKNEAVDFIMNEETFGRIIMTEKIENIHPMKLPSNFEDPFLWNTSCEDAKLEFQNFGLFKKILKPRGHKMAFKRGQRLHSYDTKLPNRFWNFFLVLAKSDSDSMAHGKERLKWHRWTNRKPKFKQK